MVAKYVDTFRTIAAPGEAVYTEKRSKFLAFASHASDAAEALDYIATLRKAYHDARHVCWAYTLGPSAEETRSNDDGEPSGSAGKPILGQLRSADVTYAVVAVVRYFGGVKLGTGGLAAAYKTAAAAALANAQITEQTILAQLQVFAPFADTDFCLRSARKVEAQIKSQTYTPDGSHIVFAVRESKLQTLRQILSQRHTLQLDKL